MSTYAPFAKPLYVMLKPVGAVCNLADVYKRQQIICILDFLLFEQQFVNVINLLHLIQLVGRKSIV